MLRFPLADSDTRGQKMTRKDISWDRDVLHPVGTLRLPGRVVASGTYRIKRSNAAT